MNHMRKSSRSATSAMICTTAIAAMVLSGVGIRVAASANHGREAVEYVRRSGSKAPFSEAVRVGNVLYLSGQIGAGPDGRLSSNFDVQARQAMTNLGQELQDAGSSFHDVIKCTVMLTDMSRWAEFNRVYVTYFDPSRLPARSTVGANGLALGAALEIECLAYSPPRMKDR